MNAYQVQNVQYCSGGAYDAYPWIFTSSYNWNKFQENKYKIQLGDHKKWDLIKDAGFKEGDEITCKLNVVAGPDKTANEKFIVTANGATASYFCYGTSGSAGFTYTGTRPA